jgi:hypothetical protein
MIDTRRFRKARSVNATNTSFASKIPTRTEPSGDAGTATGASVIDLCGQPDGPTPSHAMCVFYGTGDSNDIFEVKLIGWRRVGSGLTTLWVPTILAHLVCTLGTSVGVAGGEVLATEAFVDTITVASAGEPTYVAATTNSGTVRISSPAGDLIGFAEVPLLGCQKLELIFDMTTGDPTGGNALLAFVDRVK